MCWMRRLTSTHVLLVILYQNTTNSLGTFYVPGILAFIAAVIGTAGNIYCETVQFTQQQDTTEPLILYGGVFTYRTNDVSNTPFVSDFSCKSYGNLEDSSGFEYDIDAKTRATMAFSIITPILGGLAVVLACVGPCCTIPAPKWKAMGAIFILSSIFQGITLLVLESSICLDNPALQYMESLDANLRDTFPDTCEWYTGFYLNIVAVVLWFLAGVAAMVLPAPHVDPRQPQQTQTVTYQSNPDGTVQETSVMVVKGTNVNLPSEGAKPY